MSISFGVWWNDVECAEREADIMFDEEWRMKKILLWEKIMAEKEEDEKKKKGNSKKKRLREEEQTAKEGKNGSKGV